MAAEAAAANLKDYSEQLADTVERAAKGVVAVQARSGPGSSGVVWRDNLVVTSCEGIRTEEGIRLLRPDGRVVEVRLRGADPGTDLALLEADTSGIAPLALADAAGWRPGHLVLAVGRTVNTGPIASFGIVSGVASEWKSWRGGKIDPFVRLDLAAYPTQAGAAAVNAAGGWVGLVSTGLSRSSVLAVTRPTIERVAGRLAAGQPASARGFLGAALQPVALSRDLNQKRGIMLVGVEAGGPAEKSGLLLGDILLAAGDVALDDPGALAELLDSKTAGDVVKFRIVRAGVVEERAVILGARPRK